MVTLKKNHLLFGMLVTIFLLQACRNKCSEGERGNPYIDMSMIIMPGIDSIRLGDTLTVTIEIPFDNINTRDGSRIDISRSTTSEFGIDHRIFVNIGDTARKVYGLDQFKIIYERGGGGKYTVTSTQNRFEKTATGFLFRAKVIPLKRGLVNLVNYRAEGEMEKGCVLVDFSPFCGNANKHHSFFADFHRVFGETVSPPGSNHYYVWVR
jgi:hypothetical protein